MRRLRFTARTAAIATGIYAVVWCAVSFIFDIDFLNTAGWAVFYLIGLGWAVWYVERTARRIEAKFRTTEHSTRPKVVVGGELASARRGGWNPFDPASKLYGRTSQKLRQSFATLAAYSLLFMLVYFLAHIRFGPGGEESEYDLPSGGGNDSPQAMSVKVQKIIRKKYVVNPYSSILFAAPPPIDNVQVNLEAETANRYQVGQGDGGLGQGDGEGGGFGSGTSKGKIRWIRLRHADKGWDKNYGIGGDRNLLLELEVRFPKMKGRVGEESENVDCVGLGLFKEKAAPPLIYIGGNSFNPSAADKRILKQYVLERHGMILGDSLGPGFHGGFIAAMTEITGVQPVPIPRDDAIHKRPFEIPQLPIVVAHGGTTPYGWKIDGRWAGYYHPGALSDAWRDDRAGIKKAIADSCYQLGLNIVSYAHREHDTWRRSQQP
ncbi:MAG: DUF4159 domain-containing protein [Gemmataceae bacterium]